MIASQKKKIENIQTKKSEREKTSESIGWLKFPQEIGVQDFTIINWDGSRYWLVM